MSAGQTPVILLGQPARGVHEILQEAAVHRLVWREEFGVILEKLTRFDGAYQACRFKHLGDVTEIGDQTGQVASQVAIEKVTGHNVAAHIIDYVELVAKVGRRKDKVGA